jgi:arylsulfatase A-like enzyme
MNQYLFFPLICLFLLSTPAKAQSPSKPNILVILTDDLGIGDVSCYGGKNIQTPAIDQLSSEGLRLTQFYANSTVCSPSRASILTGRYPDLAGVPGVIRQNKENSWGFLNDELPMMPTFFKSSGYHTAMIGKWHLGFNAPHVPHHKGFDLFKGYLGDMMDDYYTHLRGGINWMRHNNAEIQPTGHATDIFTNWTIEYLQERRKEKKPFLLYLAFNAPHFPIQPPADWLQKVRDREPGIPPARAANIALVEHLDHSIGRIIESLKKNGQYENTIIVFTSDNGGSLAHAQSNGELNGGKQNMLEGGIRVPTIIVWKNKIMAGSTSGRPGLGMDLLPTLAAMTNTNLKSSFDGISLWNDWQNGKQTDERTLFWVRREGPPHAGLAYYAARKGSLKILQNNPFQPFQFYDLSTDPLEKQPLKTTNDPRYQELIKSLMEHIRQSGAVPWQGKE